MAEELISFGDAKVEFRADEGRAVLTVKTTGGNVRAELKLKLDGRMREGRHVDDGDLLRVAGIWLRDLGENVLTEEKVKVIDAPLGDWN